MRVYLAIAVSACVLLSSPTTANAQSYVTQLLEPTVEPFQQCLQREIPGGVEGLERVTVRFAFPFEGGQITITDIDAIGDEALTRCLQEALQGRSSPAYQGTLERAECSFPIVSDRPLECHPWQQESQPQPQPQQGPQPQPQPQPQPEPQPQQSPPTTEAPTAATGADQFSDVDSHQGGRRGLARRHTTRSEMRYRHHNITVNPLGLVFGGLSLTYTYATPFHVSVGTSLIVQVPLILTLGVGGALDVLFHIRERPNSGFYGGLRVLVAKVFAGDHGSSYMEYIDTVNLRVEAKLGYRWLWGRGINLGLGGAVGYQAYFGDCEECYVYGLLGNREIEDGGAHDLAVHVDLDIGFAF